MRVKGEVLQSLPIFLMKRQGSQKYKHWLKMLSHEAHAVYSGDIDDKKWYPLPTTLTEPTVLMCDLFYRGSLRGAWECGRYSAEYALKGIYKLLLKLQSPDILIKKASSILESLYEGSRLSIEILDDTHLTIYISEFPDMHSVLEYRIGGWMEKALEISGCRHVNITIPNSLTNGNSHSEFRINWQKKF